MNNDEREDKNWYCFWYYFSLKIILKSKICRKNERKQPIQTKNIAQNAQKCAKIAYFNRILRIFQNS